MIIDERDAVVERLLRAGRADGPSARTLRAAPAAVTALLASSATQVALAKLGAGAVARVAEAAVSPLLLVKWVAVGAVASVSLLALTQVPQLLRPVSAPSALAVAPLKSRQSHPASLQRVGSVNLPQAAPVSSDEEPSSAVAARPDVAREVSLLDSARAALVDGSPSRALRSLDALERLPNRVLAPEATVLRVRALLAQGSVEDARRVAGEFATMSPRSPQVKVLRALLADAPIRSTGSGL